MIVKWHAKKELVKCFDKVTIKELLLINSFANKFTDELEHLLKVRLYVRFRVRVVTWACIRLQEESEVGIKYLLTQKDKPFLGQSSLIDALLIYELNI